MTPLMKLIEQCRRKQQQKPGQLEITDDDGITIGDIEEEEMWQEHTRKRMSQPTLPLFDSGDPSLGDEISETFGGRLMAIYEEQSDFMRTLAQASADVLWASAEEAMDEWRSRTLEDWGFARWIEA